MSKQFMYEHDAPIVSTTGGKVHGYQYDEIFTFKGIPYARAKRFQDPEKVTWDGIYEAITYNYSCPVIEPPHLDTSLDFARRHELKDEACQNLNIWTPGLDDKKRPVMVWLHGGGLSFGSSSEDGLCEGDQLAKHGDVVLVSINHRLNILGYCDLSDFGEKYKNSGNQGNADMVAALQWVHDNIEAFGGDPGNVTIFGQSGGGMKVTSLIQCPYADGLFHKAMVISGVAGGAMCDCVGSGKEMGEFLMRETGCSNVDELSEVSLEALMAAARKMRPALKFRVNAGEFSFRNYYYAGDPNELGFREETKNIPVLVGSTFGEFYATKSYGYKKHEMTEEEMLDRINQEFGEELAAILIPLFREAYPDRPVVDLVSLDYMFKNYIIQYVNRRCAMNDCTWEYVFNLDMPMLGGVSPLHGNDLGYWFHTTDKAPALQEPGVTEEAENVFFQTVMAFVRTGNPNNPLIPEWKPSKPGEINTFVFDKNSTVRTNFDRKLNEVLSEYVLKKQVEGMLNAVAGRGREE